MSGKYEPQLATLAAKPPAGDAWLHELKYDGYRIGCVIEDGRVRLISRNGNDWTRSFPTIVEALDGLQLRHALLDGEMAVILPDGRTSFQSMQNLAANRERIAYFVFDLLQLKDQDLRPLALEQRKRRLKELLAHQGGGRLRAVDHVVGNGPEVFARASELGAEGIVSKRRDRPYRRGRSSDWLKVKCVRTAHFVVCGFTEPAGARAGIGALLLGCYGPAGELLYAGRVGTGKGFTAAFLTAMRSSLRVLEQPRCPFQRRKGAAPPRGAHWLSPELVVEVQFTEWTDDGHLRHPSFVAFRQGIDPKSVTRS